MTINYESGDNYRIVKHDNQKFYNVKHECSDDEIVEEHLIEREDEDVVDQIEDPLESQLEEFLIPHTSKSQSPQTHSMKRKHGTSQHYDQKKKQKFDNANSISKFRI